LWDSEAISSDEKMRLDEEKLQLDKNCFYPDAMDQK
jgi:hypothetical protein